MKGVAMFENFFQFESLLQISVENGDRANSKKSFTVPSCMLKKLIMKCVAPGQLDCIISRKIYSL